MYYTIYKITNLLNGKYYIGKHITDYPYDDYMGTGTWCNRAIKKHGKENFQKEVLEIYDEEWKMNLAERILVVVDKEVSYNLMPGGHGSFSYINKNKLSNTPKALEAKSVAMIEYWDEEKKIEKSIQMKKYNEKHGTERYINAINKRWEEWENTTEYDEFVIKMSVVNKSEEKRKQAGETIKTLWKDENFRKKAIENRLGIVWWNNGIDTMKSREQPGPDWIRGRCNKGLGRKQKQ